MVGTSLVETAERTPNLDDTVAWDAIDAPGLNDRFYEYLSDTDDDRARRRHPRRSRRELRSGPHPRPRSRTSSTWLREHVEYQHGSTSVSTTAVEVLRAGRGVCQDYVHLGIAVLRAAGIPARYASGYLYPEVGGAVGDTHQGDSHAWLEAWVGDWHPVDPTSGAAVAERHVLVARGRDYADVAPFKGVYNGGPSRSLEVSVDLTRVA